MHTVQSNRLPKSILLLFLGLAVPVLLGLMGCASTAYQSSGHVQSEVDDVQYLSSYGEWLEVEPYGMVWRPYVVSDWEPFYYGHWIWTDEGWAWTSYEPYGWLVYHYGYWGNEPWVGWFWVPGDVWSPARVQWYTFEAYTAWAPLPPPGIAWGNPWDPYDVNIWIVVDIDEFTSENIGRYRIAEPVRRGIIQHRIVAKAPPDIHRVERSSSKDVPTRIVNTQPTRVHRQAVPDKTTSAQPSDSILKRMVLPKSEERKVEKHTTTVEREVLKPRKREPAQRKESTENRQKTERKKK